MKHAVLNKGHTTDCRENSPQTDNLKKTRLYQLITPQHYASTQICINQEEEGGKVNTGICQLIVPDF
jgi:hypothetical protein